MTQDFRRAPLTELAHHDAFIARHIGPDSNETNTMLQTLGLQCVNELIEKTVPATIRLQEPLALEPAKSEIEALAERKAIASRNKLYTSFIGMSYYDSHGPHVILRNVLERPGWYTAYTPYQPEIAQGRLEGLLNFQQMIIDLTGMDLANASMLDEGSAAAEAMAMCKRQNKKNRSDTFFVAEDTHPQTLAVLKTRAEHFGFDIVTGPAEALTSTDCFGGLLQYPGSSGQVRDLTDIINAAHEQHKLVTVASDLLALMLLKSPGDMGADVVVGNSQRFGVPMGFGGPHAAFFAFRDAYKRSAPGRIIGVSRDTRDNIALRMTMQTREQHIRREKANSNICTSQVLLALISAFYAVYHGPEGLKRIAERVARLTDTVALALRQHGFTLMHEQYFDTLCVKVGADAQRGIYQCALNAQINLRKLGDDCLCLSLDETTSAADINRLLNIFSAGDHGLDLNAIDTELASGKHKAEIGRAHV